MSTPKSEMLRYINLTKYVQFLYEENYKILMKEIRELNKWRDVPCSKCKRDRKPQYYQGVSSSQLHLQNQCNPNQNPSKLFCGYQQADSKVHMKRQRPRIDSMILKENKAGRLTA